MSCFPADSPLSCGASLSRSQKTPSPQPPLHQAQARHEIPPTQVQDLEVTGEVMTVACGSQGQWWWRPGVLPSTSMVRSTLAQNPLWPDPPS